jgi:hypothetical protein
MHAEIVRMQKCSSICPFASSVLDVLCKNGPNTLYMHPGKEYAVLLILYSTYEELVVSFHTICMVLIAEHVMHGVKQMLYLDTLC